MSSLTFASAHQLARMIRQREVSAVEVVNAYLTQIAKHNSKLNAVCTLDEDHALVRARLADEALFRGENWGTLHGVPITIKDFFETQGLRTTAGYQPLRDYVPQQDATVVARLRAAGAILVGKTNPSDVNGAYQGVNDVFPRVNNPGIWITQRVVVPVAVRQRSLLGFPLSILVAIQQARFVSLLIVAAFMD